MKIVIQQIIEEFKVYDRVEGKKALKRKSQFLRSKSGIFNFIIMVLLQVVELEVEKLTVSIIENKGQQPIQEFKQQKTPSEIVQMFKLFTTHRLYRLTLPKFLFSTKINQDENLELLISAKHFYADFKNDFTKQLDRCVKIEGPSVNFHMPFSFTQDVCINGSKIYITTKSINSEFSPETCSAFKYLKYFRTYQARLIKFIKYSLIVKEDPKRSPMPELVQIDIPNVYLRFFKLENEITDQEGFLQGQKCNEVDLKLTNVCVKVITRLHEYKTVQENISLEFNELIVNALIPFNDPIYLCNFQNGSFLNCRDYDLKTSKVIKTVDKFEQQKSELHIHPVIYQLYEAYININQRPYLEFDFEFYNTCLQSYIKECEEKYIQESKLSFTDNVNTTNNQINGDPQIFNSQSSAPTPQKSRNNNNNNSNNRINSQSQKPKVLDYLVVDDKILIETLLKTENVFQKISVPFLEQEFKTDFVEMYSYCGNNKISLKSVQPRYYCQSKKEDSVYQGIHKYTFHNVTLEKFIQQQVEGQIQNGIPQIEKIFTMESFQQDNIESNAEILNINKINFLNILQQTANMKFQLLAVSIKEETFKDVLDIKNNFNTDYLDAVRKKKFVNPYQPTDPFSKPKQTQLDFNQFSFLYEFNDNQTIQLTCDFLKKEINGQLNSQNEKTTLKGIKLTIGMINQKNKQQETVIESVGTKVEEKQNRRVYRNTEKKEDENIDRNQNNNNNDENILNEKLNKRFYDIFEIKEIEYTVDAVDQSTFANNEYKHKLNQHVQFDTLTLRIDENMQHLSDYFSDFKESTNRVKEFSLQLNLKFPKKQQVINHKYITQMFPDPFKIQWKNLSLIIDDSKMNCFLLGTQAFTREYLKQNIDYNERHILLKLNETKRQDPLIAFYCDELTLQLDPLRTANTFQSILSFIQDVDDFTSLELKETDFCSFNCLFSSAGFIGASIKMRDYPSKILQMDKGFIHLSIIFAQLNIKDKSKSLRVFYNLLTEFGNFDLTVGLCQASGINEFLKRLKQLTTTKKKKIFKKSSVQINVRDKSTSGDVQTSSLNISIDQNRPQANSFQLDLPKVEQHEMKSSKPLKSIEEKSKTNQNTLPYWDYFRLCYHGKILMSKDSVMNFNLLTHIYPYYPDCLKLSIGKSFLLITKDNIKVYIQELLLKRRPRPDTESHVLKIPLIQIECELDWNRQVQSHYEASNSDAKLNQFKSQKLNIFSKLNLPRVEPISMQFTQMGAQQQQKYATRKLKRIVKNSEVPFIHYQLEFINWIKNLPQLRRDQLYLYKIGITRTKNTEEQISQTDMVISDESDDEIQTQNNENPDEKQNNEGKKKHKRSGNSSQAEDDEQEVVLGKNTDFISLFAYSLNQQLNSRGNQNILKHISVIKTCALMSSTRVIFSNAYHHLVSDPEEDDDPFAKLDPIIGMQFVFDSIQISFNINHDPDPNKPDKQSFNMHNGFGKLDFMYGQVFKSKGNLLNLDPPQFRRKGGKFNQNKSKSMYNPEKFAQYFGLKDKQLADDMMIFNIQNELNGRFKQMSSIIQIYQDNLKVPKTDFSRYSETETDEANDEQKEFDFNISGTFFRSDSLIYEQDKSLGFEVQIQDENGVMHKEITPTQIIKNCLSFKGCKLLITSQLNNIITNVFFPNEVETPAKQLQQNQQDQSQNIQIPLQNSSFLTPQKPSTLLTSSSTSNLQSPAHHNQGSPMLPQQNSIFQSPQKACSSLDNIDNLKNKTDVLELINKKMQLTSEQSDGKIQTNLKFVLQIEDPQFNLYYKQEKNQMILTSTEKCFIMIQSHLLPYDKQKIDIKNNYKLFFNTLDCYAVRSKGSKQVVSWVRKKKKDDSTTQQQKEEYASKIFHIIRATNTVINFTSFSMPQCLLDFSKPYIRETMRGRSKASTQRENPLANDQTFKWNGHQRSRGLDLRVDNLSSELESKDYQCFLKTLEFFQLLLQTESRIDLKNEKLQNNIIKYIQPIYKYLILHNIQQFVIQRRNIQFHVGIIILIIIFFMILNYFYKFYQRQKILNRQLKYKKTELKSFGINLMMKKLDTRQQVSHISYSLSSCVIEILDSQRKPFLDFCLPSVKAATKIYSNNSGSFYLIFGQVTLKNLKEDGDFSDMIQYSGNDSQIRIENDFVDLKGIDQNTEWRAYNRYDCFIPPLTVKLTESIYDPFYDFLFDGSKKDKSSSAQTPSSARSSQSSNTSKGTAEEFAPYFYFGKVVIKDLKICLHYKSTSSLKRLNGVSAIIQPYMRDNIFNTNKELFDDFASYLKKSIGSQIFSLLSQKVFGYSKKIYIQYIYNLTDKIEYYLNHCKSRITFLNIFVILDSKSKSMVVLIKERSYLKKRYQNLKSMQ